MAPVPERLQLRAVDGEDLSVIAACLQDAVMRLGEMAYLPDERRFIAVLDRFTWETGSGDDPADAPLWQVQCALRFEQVAAVKVTGIDQADRGRVLELLTLLADPGAPGSITLVFAGEGAVRLEGQTMICYLEDIGVPRLSPVRPSHDLSDDPGTD